VGGSHKCFKRQPLGKLPNGRLMTKYVYVNELQRCELQDWFWTVMNGKRWNSNDASSGSIIGEFFV
jgi:hypothetical protein